VNFGQPRVFVLTNLNSQRGIVSAQLLCQLAQEEGMPLAKMLQNSGISMATLGNPHSRILARQELQLIQNLMASLPYCAGLGIRLGQRYRLANYGVFGFGLSSSATLQEAALFGLRFMGLSYAFSQFELRFTREKVQVHFNAKNLPLAVQSFVIERDMSALMSLVHEVTGKKQGCANVCFVHENKNDAQWAVEHFGVLPQFGAQANMAEMALTVFTQALPQADVVTHQACVSECEALLVELRQRQGWPERVRDTIERHFQSHHSVSMDAVAKELFVSSRTLRRHLEVQGTSFRQLLDEIRELKAKALLREKQHSVKAIAEQLGYQEPASFVHAFKRWVGMPPAKWRDQAHD